MKERRRGFFRDALAGLKELAAEATPGEEPEGQDDAAALPPSFVPPPIAEPSARERPARAPRRPPGALAEADFVQACTRCGACLAACPEGTLVTDAAGFPVADVAHHPCVMCRDVPCAAACEPGALVVGDVFAIARFGSARILPRLCLNHGWKPSDDEDYADGPCERCLDWCPVPGALALGDDLMPRVDGTRCTGCGLCAQHCAAYPQAIVVASDPNGQ